MNTPALKIVDAGRNDRPINQAQIEKLAAYATQKGHCGCLLNAYGIQIIVLANGIVAHDVPPARIVERSTPIQGTTASIN